MKLKDLLDAMRNGAVLRLSLAEKPTWALYTDTAVIRVSTRTVQGALKRKAIVGHSLFVDIPSQTWRHTEPSPST